MSQPQDTVAVQGIVYVEVNTSTQLQATERGDDAKLVLKPGSYQFEAIVFNDGRPEAEWAVLMSNRDFGTPMSRLQQLHRVKKVEATHKDGRDFFS